MSTMRAFLPELKRNVAKREAVYRAHADKPGRRGPIVDLEVTVRSVGDLDELVQCRASGHEFIISEPTAVSGRNIAPWPLEYLLGGAVGCFAAVFAFYAAKLDVPYDEFEATARTRFNASGHVIPDSPPSAFQGIELDLRVVSDAPEERLKEVERLALAGCPGIESLRNPMEIASRLTVVGGDGDS